MSPTCATRLTLGSSLTAVMKAGGASSSAVSVLLVPYGASPYTAIVNGLPASALLPAAAVIVITSATATAIAGKLNFRICAPLSVVGVFATSAEYRPG